jgi:pyruvate/2-oxoglutarate dehydrogenase complex dihydrolipoamide dehydrogenase (E3) component
MSNHDAIVIGTGQSGPALARRLVAAGQKVAVIERKFFGGTCVNTGCTPTKALVASAYGAYLARRASDYGLTIGGPVEVDMQAVKARKDGHHPDGGWNARSGIWKAARSTKATPGLSRTKKWQ